MNSLEVFLVMLNPVWLLAACYAIMFWANGD